MAEKNASCKEYAESGLFLYKSGQDNNAEKSQNFPSQG